MREYKERDKANKDDGRFPFCLSFPTFTWFCPNLGASIAVFIIIFLTRAMIGDMFLYSGLFIINRYSSTRACAFILSITSKKRIAINIKRMIY